ncbi:MAG: DUF2283 domain-containing protein [Pseudomonadales bacterium]
MKVKYFKDTDTALLEFTGNTIERTEEINENIYIDLDAAGDLVSITIEHAKRQASLPDVVVEQFDKGAA